MNRERDFGSYELTPMLINTSKVVGIVFLDFITKG